METHVDIHLVLREVFGLGPFERFSCRGFAWMLLEKTKSTYAQVCQTLHEVPLVDRGTCQEAGACALGVAGFA